MRTNAIFTKARIANTKANTFKEDSVLRVIIWITLEYNRMLKTKVIIRTGNIIFFLLIKITVGLWGILSTNSNSNQNIPKRAITTINCDPKVSGKLLWDIIARFVPWRARVPP